MRTRGPHISVWGMLFLWGMFFFVGDMRTPCPHISVLGGLVWGFVDLYLEIYI